ncbi:4Fe-4S binding protein [candidate division KSB1 bacterium]|nr:4Fe-4S binding protein [candidate division KSB1 bacterium]
MLRQQAKTIQNQLQEINASIGELLKGKPVRHTAYIDHTVCTGCGRCVKACPHGAFTLVNGSAHVDRDACTGCGICVTECPKMAISMQKIS